MRTCKLCKNKFGQKGYYCPSCYAYLRIHPEGIYELPNAGEIRRASNGDPICHICGMAYRKLGNHIAFKHHMTQNEYRDMFKLYHNTKLSNYEYIDKMSQYNNIHKDIVVKENLIKGGKKTRITPEMQNMPKRKYGGVIPEKTV